MPSQIKTLSNNGIARLKAKMAFDRVTSRPLGQIHENMSVFDSQLGPAKDPVKVSSKCRNLH